MKIKSIPIFILLATTLLLCIGCNNVISTPSDDGNLDKYGLTQAERKALEGEDLDSFKWHATDKIEGFEDFNNSRSREFKVPESKSASSFIHAILRGENKYIRTVNRNGVSGMYIAMTGEGPDGGKGLTTSEATGYGMRLAIYGWKGVHVSNYASYNYRNEYKNIFDNLWKLQHSFPSNLSKKTTLHSWYIPKTLNPEDSSDAATDGELDMAYALIQAHDLWGSSGEIDYKTEAGKILNGIVRLTDSTKVYGKKTTFLKVGDWASDGTYKGLHTRPSDWMLHHFRTFVKFIKAENIQVGPFTLGTLERLIEGTEFLIQKSPWTSGLMPDFINLENGIMEPSSDKFSDLMGEKVNAKRYSWNACRIPWRLAMDVRHEGKWGVSATALNKIFKTTLHGKSALHSGSCYRLDGSVANIEYESAFGSPIAVSLISRMRAIKFYGEWVFLNKKYQREMEVISSQFSGDPKWGYFGDCITAFCLVILENDKHVIEAPY